MHSSKKVYVDLKISLHTSYEHLDLTEAHVVSFGKMDDDVYGRRYTVLTVHRDRLCAGYCAWILTAQRVLPQSRTRDERTDIGQSDDEIVSHVCYNNRQIHHTLYCRRGGIKRYRDPSISLLVCLSHGAAALGYMTRWLPAA